MTILNLVQLATENKHHNAAIDAPAHGIAPRPPLTAVGMAAYAGVMATFTGTDGDDTARAEYGTLTGFTGGTLAELQDAIGDTIIGGAGYDLIVGGAGADLIDGGGGGLDEIDGGAGADTIIGGAGNDRIIYDGSDFSIDGGAGDDCLVLDVTEATTIDLNSSDQTSGDTAIVTGFEYVDASESTGNVSMTGNADKNNGLTGGSGDDTLIGGDGNDYLIGRAGADMIYGGDGDDYITYDGSDVSIAGGAGTDGLNVDMDTAATIDLSLADQTTGDTAIVTGFENVSASGSYAGVSLTGDANANRLSGGYGNDTIIGGAGDDYIQGDYGADWIEGGDGDDRIVWSINYSGSDLIAGGAGTDTLILDSDGTIDLSLVVQSSGVIISGVENVDASAHRRGVSLTGDANANRLEGGAGADTLNGGAGDDYISGGGDTWDARGDDTINGGAGNDTITGVDADWIDLIAHIYGAISGAGEDLIDGGAGNDTIDGGGGADWIDGGADNDTIVLDRSDVSIAGGTGNDTLIVTGAVTINLSLADQTSGDTANVTGFENVDASTSSAVVSLTGDANANKLTGGSGNDTISGGAGADTIDGGAGNDTIKLANGHFAAGESLKGGTGIDTIVLTNATEVDFSTGMFSGLNALTGSSGGDTVTMTVRQWAGFNTIDLGAGTDVLNVKVAGTVDISGLGTPAVLNVETGNLTGTSGDDRLTLTGAQLNAILDGTSSKIDLGAGDDDSIYLTSDSTNITNLNAHGDDKIAGVEAISAASATAGVTINLNRQAEAFSITGGKGADTIDGGAGNDTIKLANGDFAAGESLTGGSGTDTIVLTNATEIDFSTGTLSGLDTLTGSAGNDTVTMTVSQWGGFDAIDLGAGTGVLNIKVSGTKDISAGAPASISGVDAGSLAGSGGNDWLTLTGAQLDAILISTSSSINLGGGEDFIILTSNSADISNLNAHGDDKIAGVEHIYCGKATTGVSISLSNQTEDFVLGGSDLADTITGGHGADGISGFYGNDILNGREGDDTLEGWAGDDTLNGGTGNDTIYGGDGTDTFVFNTALSKDSNIDRIISFGLLENDTIQLENSVFTKLAAGALSGSAFYIGTAAHDADDRIIYNETTGALSYDVDGKGGSAAVQFATLADGLALNKADFMVV